MNQCNFLGRMVREPELRTTQTGVSVTSFTLAVDRRDKEKNTDFIDFVAFRQTAEFVSKYFAKGQMIAVTGRLQIRDWQDKDGNKRRSAEVVSDNVYFTESKKPENQNFKQPNQAVNVQGPEFTELDDDDGEFPF